MNWDKDPDILTSDSMCFVLENENNVLFIIYMWNTNFGKQNKKAIKISEVPQTNTTTVKDGVIIL